MTRRDLLRRAGVLAGSAAALSSVPGVAASAATGGVPGVAPSGLLLQLARVWPDAGRPRLLDAFDETHTVFADGSIEVLLWPGDRARLDALRARYEITVDDLIARDTAALQAARPRSQIDLRPQPGERTGYRTLADINADLQSLAQRFPDTVKLFELPHRSHEGRTVYGVEIARNVHRKDGRSVFYVDGVHHSREWPSAEMPIMFAFDLAENDGVDPRITNIVDNVRTIIVPVMNPDGFNFSRSSAIDVSGVGSPSSVTGNAYWRKNRRGEAHATDPVLRDYGRYGVDPNRNYAYAWGGAGASGSTTSDTYRGPTPLSEPENRNVAAILSSNHVAAMVTNHTSGRLVLWAWSWTTDDLAAQSLIEGLGRAMASHNGYTPQKSIDLYIHTGVLVDYAYGTYGTISYTFEHATAFHPAYAETVPAMYAANRPAYLLLAEEACLSPQQRPAGRDLPTVLAEHGYDPDQLNHAILRGQLVDAAGKGVAGTVRLQKSFETPLWERGNGGNPTGLASITESVDTAIETAADGSFSWHVLPSTRPEVAAEGITEAYTLTAQAGSASAARDVVVARGEIRDLGVVAVS